jgi:hypothetical protein
MPAKPARITELLSVGITPQLRIEIEAACDYFGLTPSQYVRQAAVEKLMRDGIRRPPVYQQPQAVQAAE